jgi:hypothetical protein
MDILTASYEGVSLLTHSGDKWTRRRIGTGNQDNPKSNRGSSEIKRGRLKSGRKFIATIEPWHGHQVVVYTEPDDKAKLWNRDGSDELIIGVRDDLSQQQGERRGIRIYKALDDKGTKWTRHIIDNGGVAVEDLAAADLDGDGKIDIVAVGRQTHNIRIYWNGR